MDRNTQGAEWFQFSGRRRGARTPFWDEHSLNEQRYFNILCWVYGSNPVDHTQLLELDWGLPRARAEQCPAEFGRMSRAWTTVLEPHKH